MDKVHVLNFWSVGPDPCHNEEELRSSTPQGHKNRGTGRPADIIKAMGATPVALEMGDVYDACQRGLLDGVYDAMEIWKGFRLGDVLKYGYLSQRGAGSIFTFYVAMNKRKWDSLPKDVQKIMTDTAEEWVDKHAVTTLQADQAGMDYLVSKGGKVLTLPDAELKKMKAAVQPVIDDYMKSMDKGSKKADMQAQLNYIYERIDYWSKQEKERKLKSPYEKK
jgi:TRAP-type C4-dicarboxylate transport system substrate-binding protein